MSFNWIHRSSAGFTLIELLVVITIIGLLAGLALPVLSSAQKKAERQECLSTMRSLGQALLLYAGEHQQSFPRSMHSAGSNGESGWALSIAPYLGYSDIPSLAIWTDVFNRHYRCPRHLEQDPTIYSYGLNVFYELNPNGDDYAGSPATYDRLVKIPHPARTILLAETHPVAFGDHFMSHQWSSLTAARNAVSHERHDGKSNFIFADGHAETLSIAETFDPSNHINAWNPGLAQ